MPAAEIIGKRWDVPLGYAPELDRFLVLGGRTTWADYKRPRSYDVLTLALAEDALAEAKCVPDAGRRCRLQRKATRC